MAVIWQPSGLILPTVYQTELETESVADALEHTSIEVEVRHLKDKSIQIVAMEIVAAGVPGNLQMWVETSPYPSTLSTAFWAAIGGGGGVIAPTSPVVGVGTGVHLTVHTFILPWSIHSEYVRLVVQTPVAAAAASWLVQARLSGKG
ncbi:MAG: hypothetical protein Q7R34_05495 [Dehalococcoidia bacterium]|nr:hypothetical protein [Dehalococcoidia bacterium]